MIIELSDTIDCLYDTYHFQTEQLIEYGYSAEEAFWIHFTSVSFMPWSEQSQNLVPLSQILEFYTQLYRDEIVTNTNGQSKTFIKCLLKSKFDLAYSLSGRLKNKDSLLSCVLDIGRCALPSVNDNCKQALAGYFVINALPISERIDSRLPLGRLVWDMSNDFYLDKSITHNMQKVFSCDICREIRVQ